MTSPETVDEDLIEAALLAQVNTALANLTPPATAHAYGDADTPARDYVLVEASRMFGGLDRIGGLGSTAWRCSVRAVGDRHNVGILLSRCNDALEERTVTVTVGDATFESGALRFETATDLDEDDDDRSLWSRLRGYTFAF